jgi:spermidine/putrescine-binding protein
MAPISVADVPSLAKMYPFFQDSPIWRTAPGADTYNSVPWTWGAIGINYLTDKVEAPESWNVLIDPKNKGRVGTIDDAYNNVSIAAIALGLDLTRISHDQLNGPIKDWLQKLKANAKTISTNLGDQQTLLVNKEVDYMSVGLTLFVVGAKGQGADNVGFVVPKEGGFGFCDAAFVTPWAPHRENALAFCEALLDGETAALAADNLAGGVAVPDVVPLLDEATRSLYPYDRLNDYLTKELKFEVNYTPESGQDIVSFDEINSLWQQIKAT